MSRHSMGCLLVLGFICGSPSHAAGAEHLVEVGSPTSVISLDGDDWLLATDPDNVGREQQWWNAPRAAAKTTKVPWIIQDAFPEYHGVAWYWRDFVMPENTRAGGRYLLRFWAVDYKAEVWLNDVRIGSHEGAESPFVFDVTHAAKPNTSNRLAVRVLNPKQEGRIDGLVLEEIPHRNKGIPFSYGGIGNKGGIWDSVELMLVPETRVEDVFVRPNWKTGEIHVQANLHNASERARGALVEFTVAPAASGRTLSAISMTQTCTPGDTLVEGTLHVENPRLWELNDPFLYRVTCRVTTAESSSRDEHSVRCGFRDFRFENGWFRLNGKRIFLRGGITTNATPVGLEVAYDHDLLRRDLINAKAMRLNMIRCLGGVPKRYQLDLADEIGILYYTEPYASWFLGDSPHMAARFDESILGMIHRDRNHPCLIAWGLLNENYGGDKGGTVLAHAEQMLPTILAADDSRMVFLNSGFCEVAKELAGKCYANPGQDQWQTDLYDTHPYPRVPHRAKEIDHLRTICGTPPRQVFLSEYGIGSGNDLLRMVRTYEQLDKTHVMDARFHYEQLEKFTADYEKWRLAEVFDRPEDFFAQSLERQAGQRLLGLNALRSNPRAVGHVITGLVEQVTLGDGIWTAFRELKPGTTDAIFDGFAPLRWCTFVEPAQIYRGSSVHVEAVLSNEDVLRPGEYPATLEVFGPETTRAFRKSVTVVIPDAQEGSEPRMVIPVLSEDVVINGPPGKYRFVVKFDRGAAAAGGESVFYVSDGAAMPPVNAEITLWGKDAELAQWLDQEGMGTRQFSTEPAAKREVILVGRHPEHPGDAQAFAQLARRMARGATVVFLDQAVFDKPGQPTGWLPLANKGGIGKSLHIVYHPDQWTKRHPIFDGLPTGRIMDYTYYREIVPDPAFVGLDPPPEAVAGGITTSYGYFSGLYVAVYNFGAGRFILNTLFIREHLGEDPVAERLLRNMLRYAARDLDKPVTELPADFARTLDAIGYR